MCGLFVVLILGSVYFIVDAKYIVACGACLVPFGFMGTLIGLAIRKQGRRVIPGGYHPLKGEF
jgi:hypothetical protein